MKHRKRIRRVDGVNQRYWVGKSFRSFTPSRRTESYDLIAAKKFGVENLKKMQKVGSGRDRDVFRLDDTHVLKLAKRSQGLEQNRFEHDLGSYYFEDMGKLNFEEEGKDYVVTENVGTDKKQIRSFLKQFEDLHQGDVEKHTSRYQDVMNKSGFGDLLNYTISMGDFKHPSSWGIKDGKPVLIDAGVLHVSSTAYYPDDLTKNEWEKVKSMRRTERSVQRK